MVASSFSVILSLMWLVWIVAGDAVCAVDGFWGGWLLQRMVSELDLEIDDTPSKQPVFMVFPLCCMPWTIP
jgi:hypothetical protein